MTCNMDTDSGLQISVFPQEGLPASYPVCSGLFFTENICWQSFRFENLMMTLLCLPTRWKASILFITGKSQLTFLKILRTLSSSSFGLTDSGIPATSKHSLLEYWTIAQHCLLNL